MALKKKRIDLSIMQSTDQITDDKVSNNPSEIKNIRFNKSGEASKRKGLSYIDNMTNGKIVFENEGTPYAADSTAIYSINRGSPNDYLAQVTTGSISNISSKSERVFSGKASIVDFNHARGENFFFVGYVVPVSGSSYSSNRVYTLDDNFNIVEDLISTSTIFTTKGFSHAKPIAYTDDATGLVFVDYIVRWGTVLYYVRYDEEGLLITEGTISITLAASGNYAVCQSYDGAGYWVGIYDSTGKLNLINYDSTTSTFTVKADTLGATGNTEVISISPFDDGLVLSVSDLTDCTIYTAPLGAWPTAFLSAAVTISPALGGGRVPENIVVKAFNSGNYVATVTTTVSGIYEFYMSCATKIATTINFTGGGCVTGGCGNNSGIYISDDAKFAYTAIDYINSYNPIRYFIEYNLTSKDRYRTVGTFSSGKSSESTSLITSRSNNDFSYYNGKIYQAYFETGSYGSPVKQVVYSFDLNARLSSLEYNRFSLIYGSQLSIFDGTTLNPMFTTYPTIWYDNGSGTGPYIYYYTSIYTKYDGLGNKIRSLTSEPYQVVEGSAISGSNPIQLIFHYQGMLIGDSKNSTNEPEEHQIEIYRTESNGSIYYKVGALTTDVDYTDGTTDAALVSGELLYTTGEVLENTFPSSVKHATVSLSRIWTIQDNDILSYSKELVPDNSIEFNDGLTYRIPGPDFTAVGKIGRKVAVFTYNKTYLVWGNPANNIGTGQNLVYDEVSDDIGCVNPLSVVETTYGVLFNSAKGIYYLLNSGEMKFVGKDVIDYTTSYEVKRGVNFEDLNQVIYSLSNGYSLIYNYLFNIWTVDTPSTAILLSEIFKAGNRPYYLNDISNGTIDLWREKDSADTYLYMETKSVTDTNYIMSYSTGWLKFSGITGFQRVYRIFCLGSKTTDQSITIDVYNDYDDVTPSQSRTFTIAASDPLEFELHIARQKGESIKFVIYEETDEDNSDLVINAISVQVGLKSGFNKLSPDLRL